MSPYSRMIKTPLILFINIYIVPADNPYSASATITTHNLDGKYVRPVSGPYISKDTPPINTPIANKNL